jgi:hypothetical protein
VEDTADLKWRKSTYSSNGGTDCVEVAGCGGRVLVRDTKNRTGSVLRIGPAAWRRFADRVKRSLLACSPATPGAEERAGSRPADARAGRHLGRAIDAVAARDMWRGGGCIAPTSC